MTDAEKIAALEKRVKELEDWVGIAARKRPDRTFVEKIQRVMHSNRKALS